MPIVLFFSSRQISAHPIRNFRSSQSTPGGSTTLVCRADAYHAYYWVSLCLKTHGWDNVHYNSSFVYCRVKKSPIPLERRNKYILFIATYGALLAYFRRLKSVLLRI